MHTARTKALAVVAAASCAAVAASVAGQIAFVGLVVPHVLRLAVGRSFRVILPLCLLAGPLFLLGADVARVYLFDDVRVQPGVLMSLVGGPVFLWLLAKNRASLRSW